MQDRTRFFLCVGLSIIVVLVTLYLADRWDLSLNPPALIQDYCQEVKSC